MKFSVLMFAMLLCGSIANAQNDPVVMTINGHPVTRSEFEYSYNKNNSETVVDKKSVDEYVDLFINYKLKVQAAMDAGIDTTKSFRSEFLLYRNQQIRPSFINNTDIENEAWKIYKATQTRVDSLGGLVRPAHILVGLRQNAPADAQAKAKERIDSIYNALQVVPTLPNWHASALTTAVLPSRADYCRGCRKVRRSRSLRMSSSH